MVLLPRSRAEARGSRYQPHRNVARINNSLSLSLSSLAPQFDRSIRRVLRITKRCRTRRGPRPLLPAPFSNSPWKERQQRRRGGGDVEKLRIASDATRTPPQTDSSRLSLSFSPRPTFLLFFTAREIARRRADHPATLPHRIPPRHCPRRFYTPAVMADRGRPRLGKAEFLS